MFESPAVPVAIAVPVAVPDVVPDAGDVVDDEDAVAEDEDPVGAATTQPSLVKTLLSSDTCPLRARARPWTTVPVVTLIDVNAMIVPRNTEFVPNVAELPTCQNTLHAVAPLIMLTLLADAVIKSEATWKTNTACGSPCASRVRVPLRWSGPVDL